jgi:hypothetical protein
MEFIWNIVEVTHNRLSVNDKDVIVEMVGVIDLLGDEMM